MSQLVRESANKVGIPESFPAIFQGDSQNISFNATSTQSTAVGADTRIVRLVATKACYIKIGSNPTAAASTSMLLPADVFEYIGVRPGDKVAVIQLAEAGVLNVTEGA